MTGVGWQISSETHKETEHWRKLPAPAVAGITDPAGYIASPELVAAVNVAIALGQPLLVTGEPGCGKTELGGWIAYNLGLPEGAVLFPTRSTTIARDLFYSYDAVGRFHAAQNGGDNDPRTYIRYVGLGEAILRGLGRNEISSFVHFSRLTNYQSEPQRSVVVIDEIDKAQRDFPNDLLNELKDFRFSIPELGVDVPSPAEMRPIVVVTSNAERSLPDAFLRRCVYFHLEFPDDNLDQIITSRIASMRDAPQLVEDAIKVMRELRKPQYKLSKLPSTAELLGFVLALQVAGFGPGQSLDAGGSWIALALRTLVKKEADEAIAEEVLKGLQFNFERAAA